MVKIRHLFILLFLFSKFKQERRTLRLPLEKSVIISNGLGCRIGIWTGGESALSGGFSEYLKWLFLYIFSHELSLVAILDLKKKRNKKFSFLYVSRLFSPCSYRCFFYLMMYQLWSRDVLVFVHTANCLYVATAKWGLGASLDVWILGEK